jgi:hypothetical protein
MTSRYSEGVWFLLFDHIKVIAKAAVPSLFNKASADFFHTLLDKRIIDDIHLLLDFAGQPVPEFPFFLRGHRGNPRRRLKKNNGATQGYSNDNGSHGKG